MPFFGAHSGPLGGIDGKTYAFDPEQNKDPEVAYFNGMVLRVKRALQYLKTTKGFGGSPIFAGTAAPSRHPARNFRNSDG